MIVLETERLRIRKFVPEDAAFVVRLLNEPDWIRFVADRGVRTEEDGRNYIKNNFVSHYDRLGYGPWLLERKEDGQSVGLVGLLKRDWLESIDIGYALLSEHYGKGYAIEATTACRDYCFDTLQSPRMIAIVNEDHVRSQHLLHKLGLKNEGTITLPNSEDKVMLFGMCPTDRK